MYILQIITAQGRAELRWDPHKLKERDPATLAVVAEADRFLHGLVATPSGTPARAGDPWASRPVAICGRWEH